MPTPSPAPPRRPWLRVADQATVAVLLAIGLGAIGLHYVWQGGLQGRLIEIETAEPKPLQYWVDINTATSTELLVLPEIGESLAERIVADRGANGPFRDHDDLRRVRGIGPKTLEQIKPYLRPMPPVGATAGR